MPELRKVSPSNERYRVAQGMGLANLLDCERCGAELWFEHEVSDINAVKLFADGFKEWTANEGCMVCDPDGFALEKTHYRLILAVGGDRDWPGEALDSVNHLVPPPAELQAGAAERLNGVVRVEWADGNSDQHGPQRRYLLRAQPQVGSENVMPAIINTLESRWNSGFHGLTIYVTLQARDGTTLDQAQANPHPR